MIAAATYSVFSGEELLLGSIKQVRPYLDYINIVWQRKSHNDLIDMKPSLIDVLKQAGSMVEEIIEFVPTGNDPFTNDLAKRQLGMDACKNAGATHAMTMDCDEYYVSREFAAAKERVENIPYSMVPSYCYIKQPIYRSRYYDNTWVPFLSTPGTIGGNFPHMDPHRQLGKPSYVAPAVCHNFNMVRRDIEHKLSSSVNAGNAEFMDRVRRAYNEWEYPDMFKFPGGDVEVIQVDDQFGIGGMLNDSGTSIA